jgi:hypothetical protein
MCDLARLTPGQLLQLYAGIGTELRRRGMVLTENITGEVAEYLFCRLWLDAHSQLHGPHRRCRA